MIVDKIEQNKKSYIITIDGNEYAFDEEIVVKYRLVKGKELEQDVLDEAIEKNALIKYYNLALNYSIKYAKSKNATKNYLLSKGLSYIEANAIINELIEKNILNDNRLLLSLVDSLVRDGNGLLLIKNKLISKEFQKNDIELALESIDYEEYNNQLEKLYNKALLKYSKEANSYLKKNKIRRYLMSRGYLSEEISHMID